MYKDALGTEIKVGHVIAVGRYGRSSTLEIGIVTGVKITKKSAWIQFSDTYYYKWSKPPAWQNNNLRAQVSQSNNDNIIIVNVPKKGTDSLNRTMKKLIADGTLPKDYILGEPTYQVPTVDKLKGEVKLDSILSGLGAPKSLGGSK